MPLSNSETQYVNATILTSKHLQNTAFKGQFNVQPFT